MRLMFICFLVCSFNSAFPQTMQADDNLIDSVCQSIERSSSKDDSVRVFQAFQKYVYPRLAGLDSTKAQDLISSVYYRLQRSCLIFREIMGRLVTQKGDWKNVDEKPELTIELPDCMDFEGHKAFSYLEPMGDTVHVTIEKGFWVDHFADGSFSKLIFRRSSPCSFVIEFVESNNEVRKHFSHVGDRYSYEVLEKGNGYYHVVVNPVGMRIFSTFKLYY